MKTRGTQQDRRRALARIAAAQAGYFTSGQAAHAGYSTRLQHHHSSSGNWRRITRGIYRLPDWPSDENEGLILATLVSGGKGVVSHESALSLQGLSDVLPDTVHLTVPPSFRKRIAGVTLHRADLRPIDVLARSGFSVTTPLRTVADAARSPLSPEHLEAAVRDGLRLGLLRKAKLLDLALDLPQQEAVRLRAAIKAAENPR
ncbi:MAG: type IV toxin-antitoxin system AbiEi family antitoxin domain-containing protein [Acidobacteriota bacterium]|nr:type IV toxin-antitoxin system AbiEi family antitoxin domain-containing protein [Acidobacteriota bacterium]